jgi:hypothetical protein
VFKKHIWLALQVHIFFGIEDQRRTGNLFRDAAGKGELENFRNGSMRRGLTHHEPCLVYSPFCGGRLIAGLHNLAVEFRSVFLVDGSDVTFPLIRGNGRQLSDAEIVDSVVGDKG